MQSTIDIGAIQKAAEVHIPCYGADALKCDDDNIGKPGSPTSVADLFEIKRDARARILSEDRESNIRSLLQLIAANSL
jgi:hypothetical protein